MSGTPARSAIAVITLLGGAASDSSWSRWFASGVGKLSAATAAYSVAIIVKPELFTRPAALQPHDTPLPTGTVIGVRALGGLALRHQPARPVARRKAVGVAAVWGALCGLSYVTA